MSKWSWMLVAMLGLSLSACAGDDEGGEPTEAGEELGYNDLDEELGKHLFEPAA